MKTFLASIEKKNHNFSTLEYSSHIQILDEEELLILFTSEEKINLSKLKEDYLQEGINLLKNLDHAFACLIYDKNKKQLFIAKDKVGIQPLYFANTDENIIIGTHLKKFREVKSFSPTINPSCVADYLQFGFILQPNTIFKHCYKVCSGEYICFDLNNNSYITHKYWELESCYKEEKSNNSEQEVLIKTKRLLEEAVEKSSKHSQFGLSLSGGYDSSTLVALAQAQSQTAVDTFSIGFHDEKINEAHYAKKIAKHLGAKHHEYYFTEKDALELIPKMCQVYDEPFADHASSPTMLTSQLLKANNLSTIISGDGGDEVFATAENVHLLHRLEQTPMLLKKIFAKSINTINTKKVPYIKNINNIEQKQNKLVQLLLAPNIPRMVYERNTLFIETELQTHIKGYTKSINNSFDTIDFPKHAQAVDKVIGSYFKTTMVDGELMKSYAAMNHQDIRLSTPFLDIPLIEYLARVPSSIKIKNDIKKYLLKEIAHEYIPKNLIERPKSGFYTPYSDWMRGILKDILYSQINKKRLDEDNIFYTSSILNIRDQFYAGDDTYKYKLWRIFLFQLWYENFTNLKEKNEYNKG